MSQEKTHLNCKYFDTARCPNRNNEIMKKAAFDIPETKTGTPQIINIDGIEQTDEICHKCDSFEMRS